MIIFQRIESAVIFVFLLIIYFLLNFNWLIFILFLFVPDVSMTGYLKDKKTGAFVYSLGHSYFSPILFLCISFFLGFESGVMFSIIWAAHIALDRALGFGLKSEKGFKDTHLGKI